MKRFKDPSGWLTAAVCCLALFVQYGLRDSLLTSLPIITGANNSETNAVLEDFIVEGSYLHTEDYPITTYSSIIIEDNATVTELREDLINTSLKRHKNSAFLSVDEDNVVTDSTELQTTTDSETTSLFSFNVDNNELLTESTTNYYSDGDINNTIPSIFLYPISNDSESTTYPSSTDNLIGKENTSLVNNVLGGSKDVNIAFPLMLYDKLINKVNISESDVIQPVFIKETRDVVSQEFILKEDWTGVLVGLALGALPFGCFITLFPAHVIMPKVDPRIILTVSLFGSSFVGFFIELAVSGGPWGVISLRFIQGLFQGLTYPSVYSLLSVTPITSRVFIAVLVFSGTCLGTASGTALAFVDPWTISFYVFSSLGILVCPLPLLLYIEEFNPRGKLWWKSVLSPAVLACAGIQAASMWTLHTCMAGLAFCLVYHHSSPSKLWTIVLLPILGLVYQVTVPISKILTSKLTVSVLNRRRAPVIAGTVVVLTAMIVASTSGLQSSDTIIAMSLLGGSVGSTLTGLSVTKNLHDLSYHRYPTLVLPFNLVSTFMASMASFCVPACAFSFQDDQSDVLTTTKDGWLLVWLLPLVFTVPAMVVYLFLVSTKKIPSDIDFPAAGLPPTFSKNLQGVSNAAGPQRSLEARSVKSFKSIRSSKTAQTFKTAMSKTRSRTQSFQTVNDTIDGDIYTIPDDMSVEMQSVGIELQDDLKSIASGNASFKSDDADMHSVVDDAVGTAQEHRFSEMLTSTNNTDRTSAWLQVHHSVNINRPSITNNNIENLNKNDFRIINCIYNLLW